MVRARPGRPGRLWAQASRRPDFRRSRVVRGPPVTPDTDFTGKVWPGGMRMRESRGGRYRCRDAGGEPAITGEPPEERARAPVEPGGPARAAAGE
ncbi:hypothetical protein [Actinoplanes siamensis]|uniref:hypothetical protein n=1 Tax=Actinoplanes siamensis TaxID=1223317 RepID=UPI003610E771